MVKANKKTIPICWITILDLRLRGRLIIDSINIINLIKEKSQKIKNTYLLDGLENSEDDDLDSFYDSDESE